VIAEVAAVQRIVLYEGVGSRAWETERRATVMARLLEAGFSVGRVVSGDPLLPLGHSQMVVLGEFADSVPANLSGDQDRVSVQIQVLDVSGQDPESIVSLVQELARDSGGSTANGWKPWFPVIDFDRCTNCMQCLSFCLFDVYGVSKSGQIQVQNQSNCKTDCPACSRVCPEVAILFPKYKGGPINGDEISEEDLRREAMKVDISALLGGDIYAMLRDRSAKAKSRFSKERDDQRALKERERCLKKLREGAGIEIPAEVLASLPSVDQIQEKAVAAKQRAQKALADNVAGTLRVPPAPNPTDQTNSALDSAGPGSRNGNSTGAGNQANGSAVDNTHVESSSSSETGDVSQ
jgi:NAD-dependent dihydropyrimidine dehydrogenase PreA subunit